MSENEVWLTTDKNRYCSGERIAAILHMEGNFMGAKIRTVLTEPNGKTVALEPIRDGRDTNHLYTEADASGLYTLVCDIENKEVKHKCFTCFFVGDCEAAIPKVQTEPLLFVPEMWEEPDLYKLISFYLMSDGKPVPNKPVSLIFRNKNGRMTKKLSTDGAGNVFFAPYMAGTYCLSSKVSFEYDADVKIKGVAITIFSFIMPELKGKGIRTKKSAYCDL